MGIIFQDGRILFENGQIALSTACCCDDCCGQVPDDLDATYTNGCGAVSFQFHARDPSGNEWAACIAAGCEGSRCWLSDEVTITCGEFDFGGGPVGVGGAGLCNSPRTGRFILRCDCGSALIDGIDFYLGTATEFCYIFPSSENGALCFVPTHPCPDELRVCSVAVRDHHILFAYEEGFPCASCMPGQEQCDCVTMDITW